MTDVIARFFLLKSFIDFDAPFMQFTVSFFASILWFIGQYVFGDAEFGISMMLLIILDTIFGAWSSVKRGAFQVTIFFKAVIEKVILYALFISAFWIITNIKTGSGDNPMFWADWIGYSWIAGKELVSIVKHVNFIKPGWVPAFILEKLDAFEKKGKL